jgi:hypothetical protein
MKRDMDLIRNILRAVESYDDPYGIDSQTIAIEGYSEAQISGHIKMLLDGGLLEAKAESGGFQANDSYAGLNLTWDGQDFVSITKDDSLWKKAKETIVSSGVSFTVQSLLVWMKAQALLIAQSVQ